MTEELEKELFAEWCEKRKNIIPDGVVNCKQYNESKTKVLYILKEVNGGENWNLRDFLNKNGGRFQTWNNIARWQYGIENIKQQNIWDKIKDIDEDFRKTQLRKIAVVNLKKVPGKETSKMDEIWKYAWNDRELLKKQISLYSPDIVICCGTGEIVKKYKLVDNEFIENWSKSSSELDYHLTKNNRLIISHCHPQKRLDNKQKYIPLIKTIEEITKPNKS